MVLWGKQYYWKPSITIAQKVYSRCPRCPKYNSGKPLHSSQGNFLLPAGPFEIWQIDFIQMPPSQDYQYVLVMVCMFSHWIEAFPCRRATVQLVGKLILERVTPIWGVLAEIHSDKKTHFTGQTVREICKIWPIMQHFHCAYHPQSSGLVESTNGTIKIRLARIVDAYSLPWPKALLFSST